MKRRRFLELALVMGAGARLESASRAAAQGDAPRIAFTFDDFNVFDVPTLSGAARNRAMLDALEAHGLKAAVFVIGRNVEKLETMRLLEWWNEAGHLVGNHTYSHHRYSRAPFSKFTEDVHRCDDVLRGLPQFRKLLRFPFLDEGATTEQRDRMRAFLVERGYRNAHVTIDASDWYIDGRLPRTARAARCRYIAVRQVLSRSHTIFDGGDKVFVLIKFEATARGKSYSFPNNGHLWAGRSSTTACRNR